MGVSVSNSLCQSHLFAAVPPDRSSASSSRWENPPALTLQEKVGQGVRSLTADVCSVSTWPQPEFLHSHIAPGHCQVQAAAEFSAHFEKTAPGCRRARLRISENPLSQASLPQLHLRQTALDSLLLHTLQGSLRVLMSFPYPGFSLLL